MRKNHKRNLPLFSSLASILVLSACGGGANGSSSLPSPPPPIINTPPAPPAPTGPVTTPPPPGTNFNTAEFRRSDGPGFHGAIAAYEVGATGAGIIVGVIDTGIDTGSRDFTGRISPDSFDATGLDRGLQTLDGHGATVSRVIGAARDDSGIHGIAFDSTILTLRSDTEGTCEGVAGDEPACTFNDTTISAALNAAVDAGARIVNISLGGAGSANRTLRSAIQRATAANIIIVISAGNGGNPEEGEEPEFDPDNPSPFAQSILANGNGNIIISTSVTSDREISDFSNRAGDSQNFVLSALGSSICCVFEDDEIFTFEMNGQTFVNVFNGTSFSAPQISGAAALLAQAFPNLTAPQIVDILLQSADDAGDIGTDAVFGQGILNIAAAFQPIGTTALATTTIAIDTGESSGTTGASMGDAGTTGQAVSAIITDSFNRPFEVNLTGGIVTAQQSPRLTQGLISNGRTVSLDVGPTQIAFNIAPGNPSPIGGLNLNQTDASAARILAGRITAKLASDTSVSLSIRQSAAVQLAALQGQGGSSFLIARNANIDAGFNRIANGSFALRQSFGTLGLTLSAETGEARLFEPATALEFGRSTANRYGYGNIGVALDRSIGPAWFSLAANLLNEDETILGARFNSAIGRGGAQSVFLNANGRFNISNSISINGAWREGWTDARSTLNSGGTIDGSGQIRSNSFSFDVAKSGLFTGYDRIGLRFAQPTRVTSGGLNLNVPISFDFATESAAFGVRQLNLAPQGRELATELSYFFPFAGGTVSANMFYRTEPGHFENAPDDIGAAVRMTIGL